MDPLSIGIIVTVLSLGTVLLYLFNADFERHKRRTNLLLNGENNSKKGKNKPQATQQLQANIIKPVQSNTNSNPPKRPQLFVEKSCASNNVDRPRKQSIPDLIVGQESKANPKQQQQQIVSTKMAIKKRDSKQHLKAPAGHQVLGSEPSWDELDSSIAMDIFIQAAPQAATKHNHRSKINKRSVSHEDAMENLKQSQRSTTPSYSPEQLFSMIAASSLSKDEVGFAVEMLLNKIDSGDSDWKKPKSDPLERVKSQLRDHENALSVEVHNHEQTRARLTELKSQLQNERLSANKSEEELVRLRKELGVANLALEQTRGELVKVQAAVKQRDEESSKVVERLEQEKLHLQTILAKDSARGGEFEALRAKFNEKLVQIQRYELNNQKMSERLAELEAKLRATEHLVDDLRAGKQHDDYEASAKIAELKSDRHQLDKALKDQISRFKEVSEANGILGKTINELRLINSRQDEMLKQMTDERQIHEASMKRTLQEMELELKELQQKLNANVLSHDKTSADYAAAAAAANHHSQSGEREQKLISEMNQLRGGLAVLLPNVIKSSDDAKDKSNNWVQDYLVALKRLSKTVEELREPNNNNESPSKKSVTDKATLTPRKNTPSPISNGRSSSRASTYHGGHNGADKKLQETKLLENNQIEYLHEFRGFDNGNQQENTTKEYSISTNTQKQAEVPHT